MRLGFVKTVGRVREEFQCVCRNNNEGGVCGRELFGGAGAGVEYGMLAKDFENINITAEDEWVSAVSVYTWLHRPANRHIVVDAARKRCKIGLGSIDILRYQAHCFRLLP